MTYYIGYHIRPHIWSKPRFVVIAETRNAVIARFIRDSYNGNNTAKGSEYRVDILTEDELPETVTYSADFPAVLAAS